MDLSNTTVIEYRSLLIGVSKGPKKRRVSMDAKRVSKSLPHPSHAEHMINHSQSTTTETASYLMCAIMTVRSHKRATTIVFVIYKRKQAMGLVHTPVSRTLESSGHQKRPFPV